MSMIPIRILLVKVGLRKTELIIMNIIIKYEFQQAYLLVKGDINRGKRQTTKNRKYVDILALDHKIINRNYNSVLIHRFILNCLAL